MREVYIALGSLRFQSFIAFKRVLDAPSFSTALHIDYRYL